MKFTEVLKTLLECNLLECECGTDGLNFLANDDISFFLSNSELIIGTSIYQSTTLNLDGIEDIIIKDGLKTDINKYSEITIIFNNGTDGSNCIVASIRDLEDNK